MSHPTVELQPYQTEDFLSIKNHDRADAAVMEIFAMMFGFEIRAVDVANSECPLPDLDERTAIVGFSGSMRGSCQIRISVPAATSIASAMLGGAPIDDGDDDSINDAIGELCNMLAGSWKNGVAALSSECALSPPTVISGRDYRVHMSKPSTKLSRRYEFEGHALHFTLYRENSDPGGE
jgi:chemotaxis protein CheX